MPPTLSVPQLIERKREGGALTPDEIHALVSGLMEGSVLDAQMSALGMAIYFQGMRGEEIAALTAALRDSGECWTWPSGTPPKVDKHSTGGVGDKVSLVLAPLLAAAGVWVPMVSGRGLGITGGTLDKLEAIPGYQIAVNHARALQCLEKNGAFIAGQSATFCPADRKIYGLRDVTGTTPVHALIVSSIMSKKLAEGLDKLVLDVKYGGGALMTDVEKARALAEALKETGDRNGVETSYLLTPMDEPLGATVGNALEVGEAVDCLKGGGPADLRDLTLRLAEAVAPCDRAQLETLLDNGAAWARWVAMVEMQGGDATAMEHMHDTHPGPLRVPWPSPADGIVRAVDAGSLARASVRLGAGRNRPEDIIDFAVGFSHIKKTGGKVVRGEPLFFTHARKQSDYDSILPLLDDAVEVSGGQL